MSTLWALLPSSFRLAVLSSLAVPSSHYGKFSKGDTPFGPLNAERW
jgi:hypothetical protein